ncbi:hypothetical protein OY671_012734 [Metschnikowia pulcherrima]|nr:hypothetical protein OY671_012734 [Metschnikowia pulcherrima]
MVSRGSETSASRSRAQSDATSRVAEWSQSQPQVERSSYPPSPSDPGHASWRRDFRTNGCSFSMVSAPAPEAAFNGFFDSLRHFAIGASWGGVHSSAAYYPAGSQAGRAFPATDRPIVRSSIGSEDVDTLKDDLRTASAAYQAQR